MNTDQYLIIAAISAYIVGAIGLFIYLLSRQTWAKRFGAPFAFIGCAVQFFELAYRFNVSHIWPLTNLYGSLSLFAAMSVAIFLSFAARYDLWFVGGLVQALAAGFLAYALTWDEGYLPAVPALQSYWIKIHVPLVVSSYAAFMVAFAIAILYLVKYYGERNLAARANAAAVAVAPNMLRASRESAAIEEAAAQGDGFAQWMASLPPLAKLDILAYRIIAVGLPLLTVGIITGAWWAKEAWGAYWQWDPKETAALFSWIVYASYMHLHTRNAWRGARSAWLLTFGFLTILFCYLGVNIWISGLHSYKV